MPFGRGRNWFGRGFWKYGALGGTPYGGLPFYGGRGRGMGMGRGRGMGRGNPYPFCRNFPWLPRGWWTVPGYAGMGAYGAPVPGYGTAYPQPGFGQWGMTPGVWQPSQGQPDLRAG